MCISGGASAWVDLWKCEGGRCECMAVEEVLAGADLWRYEGGGEGMRGKGVSL